MAETTERDPYEVLNHISYTLYQVECKYGGRLRGRVVRTSDLKSVGRGFKSYSGCYLTRSPEFNYACK